MAIRPSLFSTFTQRCHQLFSTSWDSMEQRTSSLLQTPACVCADFLRVCHEIQVEVRRQIQQWVPLFYLVSDRLSLFSFGLDPKFPVFSHPQFHLPRAGLGFQLFTLCFPAFTWIPGIWTLLRAYMAKLFGSLHHHSSLLCPIFRHSLYKSLLLSPYSWNSAFSQKPKVICMILESTIFLPI